MPDLKALSLTALPLVALLALSGCPMATTGADGGESTGGTGTGTSGGATSAGTSGASSGGSSSTSGGSTTGAGTGGTTSGGGSSGGATTSGGTGSGSGTSSGGSSSGGATTGGTGGSTSGGTTGATDGGTDAGAGDAGCVLDDCQDGGYTCCTGFDHCIDTSNDSANCGMCGKLCATDEICTAGICGTAPCNGSLCGAAGGCCLDSCCMTGQICCEVHIGAVTIKCYDATDGCPLSCKLCP